MENLRINALALHLEVDADELTVSSYNDQIIEYGSEDYLVVTDDEADQLWDEDLENYLDECLEIPETIKPYFDREAWKSDARHDGRAHSLNRYDGNEDEITVYWWKSYETDDTYTDSSIRPDGFFDTGEYETFYIYRQN